MFSSECFHLKRPTSKAFSIESTRKEPMLYLHCCKKCPQILQVKTFLQMYAAFLPVEFMTSEIENLLHRVLT